MFKCCTSILECYRQQIFVNLRELKTAWFRKSFKTFSSFKSSMNDVNINNHLVNRNYCTQCKFHVIKYWIFNVSKMNESNIFEKCWMIFWQINTQMILLHQNWSSVDKQTHILVRHVQRHTTNAQYSMAMLLRKLPVPINYLLLFKHIV